MIQRRRRSDAIEDGEETHVMDTMNASKAPSMASHPFARLARLLLLFVVVEFFSALSDGENASKDKLWESQQNKSCQHHADDANTISTTPP